METIWRDVRHAARALRANLVSSLVVVFTLAIGIGASTAIFSAVDGVLLKPLPYRDAERLLTVWQEGGKISEREELSPANFLDLRDRSTSFSALVAAEPYSHDYAGADGPETVRSWLVSDGFFDLAGAPARVGRTFRREEFTPGRDKVVVLSDGLWRRRFGGDPTAVGRSMTLNGEPYTIVGVMPATFQLPEGKELWAPKVFDEAERKRRGSGYYTTIGRLKPGVALSQARAEVDAIARQVAAENPDAAASLSLPVVPLPEQLVGRARPALLVLLAAAGLVLLIACVNVANLVLARAMTREGEFAVRLALGAGRYRLVRQVATESVLLSLLGGAAGVLVAWYGVRVIRAMSPANLPRADELAVDARAVIFALVVSLATACLVGVLPAVRAAGTDLRGRVGSGTRLTAGRGRHRARGALMIGEVALATVLLVSAGLLVRSFVSLLAVERGFRTDNVLAVTVFAWQGYRTPEQRAGFVREVVDRVATVRGVHAVGMTSSLPLAEAITGDEATLTVEGRPAPRAGEEPRAHATIATEGYFETLGIRLRKGRLLTRADDARGAPVVLVNEALVRRDFAGEEPVGKRLTVRLGTKAVTREVVGVVADVRQKGLADDAPPAVYVPHAQSPTAAVTLAVRAAGDPGAMLSAVKREIWAVNPAIPIYTATTLDALLADEVRERRFHLLLLGAFAGVALLLAAVGVYGVLNHAAGERTREMGVRMALGAGAADVVALLMRQGLTLTLAGVACGVIAAAALTRFLSGMLFGITPLDTITFAGGAALLVATAALASYLPARRAGRADPMRILRSE